MDPETECMEREIPGDWTDLVEIIHRKKGRTLILGASDTGKSTLAHFLVTRLCEMGNVVALVDGDIGQSVLMACLEQGLLVNRLKPNALRLMPPLIINNTEVDEAIEKLDRALSTATA